MKIADIPSPESISAFRDALRQKKWHPAWLDALDSESTINEEILLYLAQSALELSKEGFKNHKTDVGKALKAFARDLIKYRQKPITKKHNCDIQVLFESYLITKASKAHPEIDKRDFRLGYLLLIQSGRRAPDGKKDAYWNFCEPAYPFTLHRPTPAITENDLAHIKAIKNLRNRFQEKLLKGDLDKDNPAACALSAILHSGIADKNTLDAFLIAMHEMPRFSQNSAWVDLVVSPKSMSNWRFKRLWIDPITLALWPQQRLVNADFFNKETVLKVQEDIGVERPLSLTKILNRVAKELTLVLPNALAEVAKGKTRCHPIENERWNQIHDTTYAPPEPPELENKVGNFIKDLGATSDDQLLEFAEAEGLAPLRATINQCKSTKELRSELEELIKIHSSPVVGQLTEYLCDKGEGLSVNTIKWIFNLIGPRLASLLANDNPLDYCDEELAQLYQQVIQQAKSDSARRGMRYALSGFHKFLFRDTPTLKPAILSGIDRIDVSARLITVDEYTKIKKALDKQRNETIPDEIILRSRIAFTLFFRTGLRKKELFYLRLCDFYGKSKLELLVRPTHERTLKTPNALRKIPLYALLTPEEHEELLAFIEARSKSIHGDKNTRTDHLLFGRDNNQPPIYSITNRIVSTTREITGDGVFHLHHLRHSFASWSCLALLGEVTESEVTKDRFDLFDTESLNETREWLIQLPNRFRLLYPDKEQAYLPIRNRLYQVSTLMGHSSPRITLEHYVHTLDMLIQPCIWKRWAPKFVQSQVEHLGKICRRTMQRLKIDDWEKYQQHQITKYRGTKSTIRHKKKITAAIELSLYEKLQKIEDLFTLCARKSISASNLNISTLALLSEDTDLDTTEIALLLNNCQRHQKKLCYKGFPNRPSKEARERIKDWCDNLDKLTPKELIHLSLLWAKRKLNNGLQLQFRSYATLSEFLSLTRKAGLTNDQLPADLLTNQKNTKKIKKRWCEETKLRMNQFQDTRKLGNNKQLKVLGGYINLTVQDADSKDSSKAFAWIMTMLYISLN